MKQSDTKAALRHDQLQGIHRPDEPLAANQNKNPALSPEQMRAYIEHARQAGTQQNQFGRAEAEVTGPGPRVQPKVAAPTPDQDRQVRTEQTDARREKSDKDYEQEVRRQYRVAQTIARRKDARDRGRDDGGRDR